MQAKLDFDATKLSEALKYQIHVAIDYCHTLNDEECLWIEVFGDVTVEARDQVEVKFYADSLTDGHPNLWNTLNNWLKPEFDHQQYVNLVLLTTQSFGEQSTLKTWNDLKAEQRLNLLEKINAEFELRSSKENAKDTSENETTSPSKVLTLQRKVLNKARRESLIKALSKVRIVTDQPNLTALIEQYKRRHLRMILPHRCDEYLDDLFGFMTNANRISNGWKITGAEFSKKIGELTARYIAGTLKFPQVDHEALECKAEEMDVHKRPFAMKLDEIGGGALIPNATADLLHAEYYIMELIKDCTISQPDIDAYRRNHLKSHLLSRLGAIQECTTDMSNETLQSKSRGFYLARCSSNVEKFCNYENTPLEFRNGIYQMLADEVTSAPSKELHWRLWE